MGVTKYMGSNCKVRLYMNSLDSRIYFEGKKPLGPRGKTE